MKKIFMSFVLAVLISIPIFTGIVDAGYGGVLDGRTGKKAELGALTGGTNVTAMTDGNISTVYTLRSNNVDVVYYDLGNNYNLSVVKGYVTSDKFPSISLYDSNKAYLKSVPVATINTNDITTHQFATVNNVRYVQLHNGQVTDSKVAEIDFFEVMPTPTPTPTPTPDTTPPATPTGLDAVVLGENDIYLSWNENTEPDLKEYVLSRDETEVYRGLLNFYSDSGLDGGTSYSYKVLAIDTSDNESEQSAAVVGITHTPPTPTPTPTPAPVPTLKVQSGNGKINISWTAVAGENVIYKLYKNDVLRITTNALIFTDTDVVNGTKYTYKIQSVVDEVESNFSASVSAFPTNYVDFGEINNGMPNVIDVLLSAFSFTGQFAPYIVLVLGVMMVAVFVGFILWLINKMKLNQGEKNEKQASGVLDRVYDRLISEGKEKEAKNIIERHVKISDRQDREAKALRERVGEPEKNRKAWDDWRQRGRAEHERFEREVRERYEPTVTSGREQREARTGRAGRNDRSR